MGPHIRRYMYIYICIYIYMTLGGLRMPIEMHKGCLGEPFSVTGFPRYSAALRFPFKHGGTLNMKLYLFFSKSNREYVGIRWEPAHSWCAGHTLA